ncbi:nucleotidyltransferase domain-containing protein [Brevibacillus laterosporus]|uniref:Nucleotidyltransferase domain-containing protein n=1 Tax=Brevibacillus laterosporus TaxID=1465 RepID=A0AAP3G6N9_BRELA|nr:nucleotidyltransferase domain-containing protein [Brevibacillus laterosporus]MCR8979398.1 nucleotidyltransferase domain-containing protein [Brevibacillus laterosporus]MCZ0806553.1 nucleotidyltransferase domain-containing protein [Brevibacillus laterosporus]MCZ0825001.1 nucleotidyltransferase domain-containing protein [Brevibacillus laterosporus]MCZ0849864.1 nucleotidyltransferase domain-containing protein [Brevibacillus laterosporus]MED1665841.1 nucleotidyltransferase domain-containing prot
MEVQNTITKIVDSIKQINGVRALVLGGSRARGSHNINSDIDIGIYYDSSFGLDISGIQQVATIIDDAGRDNLVTPIGGWGPWINGGGWLSVNHYPVDFLYRDLNKVSTVMEQCLSGVITIDYQPGHPHGFINSIYFSEIALCKVLWDPSGIIGEMKARAIPYPPEVKKAIIEKFSWEATFALDTGRKGIYKTDLAYIAGCCFRSLSCLNQVLFALNECYWMNEKGAVAIADSFSIAPRQYANKVNTILSLVTDDRDNLEKSLSLLRDLIHETESLIKY